MDGSPWIALAISTICCSARDKLPTWALGSRWNSSEVERLLRAASDGCLVEDAGAFVFAAQIEVVLDREGRHQGELLEHRVDAQLPRVVGRVQANRLPAQHHRPVVRGECAGDDIDERALAGAVLPEEDVNFAGLQIEVDVAQRLNAGKALADRRETEKLDTARLGGQGLHVFRCRCTCELH